MKVQVSKWSILKYCNFFCTILNERISKKSPSWRFGRKVRMNAMSTATAADVARVAASRLLHQLVKDWWWSWRGPHAKRRFPMSELNFYDANLLKFYKPFDQVWFYSTLYDVYSHWHLITCVMRVYFFVNGLKGHKTMRLALVCGKCCLHLRRIHWSGLQQVQLA